MDWANGWMGGWIDGCLVGWVDGCMKRLKDVDRVDEWVQVEGMDGWIDGQEVWWVGECVDGQIDKYVGGCIER